MMQNSVFELMVFQSLISSGKWEANIRDKCLLLSHFYRFLIAVDLSNSLPLNFLLSSNYEFLLITISLLFLFTIFQLMSSELVF
jgi:hypothetical protein